MQYNVKENHDIKTEAQKLCCWRLTHHLFWYCIFFTLSTVQKVIKLVHSYFNSLKCFWYFCEDQAGTVPPTCCFHSALSFLFSWVTVGLWGCPPEGVWAAPTQPLWLDRAKTPRWLRRSASEEVHTQVGIQLPAISGHSLFVVRAAVLQLCTFLFLFFQKSFF